MKSLNKYIALLGLGAIILSACNKNLLEVTATDRISTDAIESDTAVLEAFIMNRYLGEKIISNEADGTNPGFGRGFEYSLWSSVTDESMYTNDDATWVVLRGQLSPENTGATGSIWARSYRSIRECNYAKKVLANITMSAAHKRHLEGELQFIRAFRYHDLIRNFGRVVLMGDTVYGLNDDLTKANLFERKSIQESMDYVIKELNEAIEKLPADNHQATWVAGRATKGAAMALKSRLLLYAASPLYNAGTWADAAKAAQDLISLNTYSLFTGGYRELFLTDRNPETIFARYYTKNANHVHLEIANGPNGYGGWGGNTPYQNLVDAYAMKNGQVPFNEDGTVNTASGYNPNNPYVDRDPRFDATILYNGSIYRGRAVETFTPKGQDSQEGNDNWNTSKTGYYLRKFMNDAYPLQNPWGNAGFQPWNYFRYAEILLNYAEAANEAYGPDVLPAGSTLTARQALNQVRSRPSVEMPAITGGTSKDEFRKHVRYERRVELAFEEHRFYDVRRWKIAMATENVPAYGVTITKDANGFVYKRKEAISGRSFEEKHYWLPIPRSEILSSNGQLEQNPSY
ncbi:carbohydrate-binding protein [Sphingobacterium faecium NBRC 15299]|uniref:RagB/SusD family nutrient uptake outer membrane protein n=1 Tax=Sphingobacterium faecium TaxID=34087 RepID=UPI000D3B725E|nr:RagB/SusD family nutrient uptake outer membrane protein [Sphingobacterium faecium]PTX11765.1 putative outer membrane starch-binding protein [Sphingobacterium faecium]GEM63450.1 carbohydrate-binding protein [Sphingobacterium faecium NBRC 15299]